ncbi:hypothetical protein EDD18DRAFT_1357098 [Armillaria luteobubalina]|uniref:Uncharacterized protein n=1 Tax=Armillaria luteobubalina TaxID=153913 RepID=A0AA39Q0S6_9AGAR|nr:hypothetical protein EDD18DRAFT_1357098 [Armillaria luteobubalina]
MIQAHLRAAGHSKEHIQALFKPEDKQDVPLTYALLKDIWSLPEDATSVKPGFLAAQKAIRFFPSLLFMDIGIMIKNAFFCVAKAKIDNPGGSFYIILLGTDQLKQLFGILHSIVGNDANLDVLQLVIHLTGTTKVANILAKHPEWDCTPQRLRLPAITQDEVEVSNSKFDHINPASW